ncbi:hypothetical protein [Kitasatospora sp. DSM 101779]|uniref:hypothetical protein n=1 Tax=Kitasatospora sp. DSM 101779 TaxID=2853165 RepID=UPI0021DB05A8|nr:hypothetical protein [Kitasatospora sp. DSM 101779]MCU7822552.1 hypothetical protein [Kitasatospora sp. DSM 101779]
MNAQPFHALSYEVRRLRGLRSTWLIAAAVLVAGAAAAAVAVRQQLPGPLSAEAGLRTVAAVVPLSPLPVAALGACLLGALSYAHEVGHPGLPASRVALSRRAALLLAKLLVIGGAALLLTAATVLVNAAVVWLALPAGVDAGALLPGATPGPTAHPEAAAPAWGAVLEAAPTVAGRPLGIFAAVVVLAGWAGLVATSLVRQARAGLVLLGTVVVPGELFAGLLLRRSPVGGTASPGGLPAVRDLPVVHDLQTLLPLHSGLARLRVRDGRAVADVLQLPLPLLFALLLVPPALGLAAAVALQLRRREL